MAKGREEETEGGRVEETEGGRMEETEGRRVGGKIFGMG